MMKLSATACTVLAIALFSSANGSAAGNAAVSGTIADASRAMVPKALVLLTPAEGGKGKASATYSSDAGEWEIASLSPGNYMVEVRKPGFRAHQQLISVVQDRPVRLNLVLNVGTLQENLTIQAQGTKAAQASDSAAAGPIRVGGNVQAAKVLRMVRPEYPPHLKTAGVTGNVVLQAIIGREGDILNLDVISQDVHPDLNTASTDAVKQWKYQATLLNGEPVEIVTLININFTLAP